MFMKLMMKKKMMMMMSKELGSLKKNYEGDNMHTDEEMKPSTH